MESSGERTCRERLKRHAEKLDFILRIVCVVVMIEWEEGSVKGYLGKANIVGAQRINQTARIGDGRDLL